MAWAENSSEDFFSGKTLSMVVSSSSGGGYDTLARLLTPFIARHTPGQPTIIIQNMPGAGGIRATNYLYTIAAQDGSVLGAVQNNTPFEPLFGTREATYDATKFNWLGSPSVETGLLLVAGRSPVDSIEKAKAQTLRMGASGSHSTPSFYARLLNETLHLKLDLIIGYPGQNDALLAMERGEIDGYPSAFYNSIMATRPDWIPGKKVHLLVQFSGEKEQALPDVPFIFDLLKNDADRQLWRAAVAPLAIGRPYLLPPNVPEDRVAALRKAFWEAVHDPEFLREQAKLQIGADNPRSGEQLQSLIEETYSSPSSVLDRMRALQNP